jgi:anti-sigma regulatory factor (Ser/Thr protein kinase)
VGEEIVISLTDSRPASLFFLTGGAVMRELSLHVMDIAQNSITAGATEIEISVLEQTAANRLTITITDNGRGMDAETLERVQSPFYTTRTTRDVGLGIPLYTMASEMTGGAFQIESAPGEGTVVTAEFRSDHIDMIPLGSISETIRLLITCNPDIDFIYRRGADGQGYALDTREMREMLGGDISLADPEIALWLGEYLCEQDGQLAVDS